MFFQFEHAATVSSYPLENTISIEKAMVIDRNPCFRLGVIFAIHVYEKFLLLQFLAPLCRFLQYPHWLIYFFVRQLAIKLGSLG